MTQETPVPVDDLVQAMPCPNGREHACAKCELESHRARRHLGTLSYIRCTRRDGAACPQVLRVGPVRYCNCPVRMTIARRIQK